MKRFFLVLILLLGWFPSVFAIVHITSLRASASSEKTRLVLDLTNRTSYSLFDLSHPNRLVLDVKNAKLSAPLKISLAATPIKDLRMSSYKSDNVRIVMDLKQKVQAKSFWLKKASGHDRLVIDLFIPSTKVTLPLPVPVALKSKPSSPSPAPIVTASVSSMNSMGGMPKSRDIIIVIDPGHGGKDPGTTGVGGTHEKNVVLAIAKDLQRALNNEPGFKAKLTRSGDYYIPLRGRLDIARKDKADMFIAIHADAYKNNDALGASVFALSERGATSEAARWLAEKENRSELLGGANLPNQDNLLRSVLIDLSQTNTIAESLQIGSSILRQLSGVCVLHHARVEQAAFVVLKSPDIPSVLVETGFLSTPAQERQLINPRYQLQIANAIESGIKSYFVRNPPQGTLFARTRNE